MGHQPDPRRWLMLTVVLCAAWRPQGPTPPYPSSLATTIHEGRRLSPFLRRGGVASSAWRPQGPGRVFPPPTWRPQGPTRPHPSSLATTIHEGRRLSSFRRRGGVASSAWRPQGPGRVFPPTWRPQGPTPPYPSSLATTIHEGRRLSSFPMREALHRPFVKTLATRNTFGV